ncbi:class A beta-lactamase-related serine hydrolase [Candidatus Parcubacteria bacterium]|nr:class A beta-lactamase-related serine hydrolase [Candidatus Parcubacteria bacterium]
MNTFRKLYSATWAKVGFVVILVVLGVGAGWLLNENKHEVTIEPVHEVSNEYKFINPLLFIKIPESESPQLQSIKSAFVNYANKVEADKKVNQISIYYRDLNTSQWVGVNTDVTFSAASMLKVATLITVLRVTQTEPTLLSKTVLIQGKPDAITQDFHPPKNPIKIGYEYSVNTLIEHLIEQSDNVANRALQKIVGDDAIEKTFKDLELPLGTVGDEDIYTAREYSHLYRALYNATYLSREDSEKVLTLLSQTDFDDGLVAGVPEGTVVSHKFGERNLPPSEFKELHDCGIVYYPEHPYFICVMTEGYDYDIQTKIISDISRIIWDKVDKMYQQ